MVACKTGRLEQSIYDDINSFSKDLSEDPNAQARAKFLTGVKSFLNKFNLIEIYF
jgi:hypothetical protein